MENAAEQQRRAEVRAEKAAKRDIELKECLAKITATLEESDAQLDVMIQTIYRNGQAHHTTIVQVISK